MKKNLRFDTNPWERHGGGVEPYYQWCTQLKALPDSFLIAESRIPHRIGTTGIKSSQMESNGLSKKSLERVSTWRVGVIGLECLSWRRSLKGKRSFAMMKWEFGNALVQLLSQGMGCSWAYPNAAFKEIKEG